MIHPKLNLKPGQNVCVRAKGIAYEGTLKGFTETEVYIQTPLRTWTFKFEEIHSIEAREKSLDLGRLK